MSADLSAMGIDSAELRWLAARDYIAEQGEASTRKFNAAFLVAELLDLAEANAIARGEPPSTFEAWFPPDSEMRAWLDAQGIGDDGGYGPRLLAIDYLTARALILSRYKGRARERAMEILEPYVPAALRDGTK